MKNGFLLLPEGCKYPLAPKRIISLVPSQTELLADLDLEEEVIGITKFCVHPSRWFREKTKVGGTKKLHLSQIASLNPDLIIANKEENIREDITSLAARFPVYVSDVSRLSDALNMIADVGALTNRKKQAADKVKQIKDCFQALKNACFSRISTAYIIWKQPWMAAGKDTFIHEIMQKAGFENVFGQQSRYPVFELAELKTLSPELLFLSSEPYPFQEKHRMVLQPLLPNTKIMLVDGEMFSWYGSRLLKIPEYLRGLRKTIIQ